MKRAAGAGILLSVFLASAAAHAATAPVPRISVASAAINFGKIRKGYPVSRDVVIKNTGSASLAIASATVTGGASGEVCFDLRDCSAVAAGGSCTASVTMTPASFGIRSAAVAISSNASTKPLMLKVVGNAAPPAVSVSPSSLSFGTVEAGQAASREIVISNRGGSDLEITSISAFADTNEYAVDSAACATLAAGTNCTATVTLAPVFAGKKTAKLAVASNDPKKPALSLAVGGTAVPRTTLDVEDASIFVGGSGFNCMKYAPDGTLAMLALRPLGVDLYGGSILFRTRAADGSWSEEPIEDWNISAGCSGMFGPCSASPQVALFFDSAGIPHILNLSSGRHYLRADGAWKEAEPLAFADLSIMPTEIADAAIGPDDAFHVVYYYYDFDRGGVWLRYGTNRGGSWQWESIASGLGSPSGYFHMMYAPRFLSIAVDAASHAHIVYTPTFVPDGHSELHYLSNVSGIWKDEVVSAPAAGSAGDAGLSASIAVNPATNLPEIVNCYISRVTTLSASGAALLHHTRQGEGWSTETIARTSDGYTAGDGQRGTGFAPYLLFDPAGNPRVVFSDHASQHYAGSGQDEFAGQIRYAWKSGGKWKTYTLYRQKKPSQELMAYTAAAVKNGIVAVMGQRFDLVPAGDGYSAQTTTLVVREVQGIAP